MSEHTPTPCSECGQVYPRSEMCSGNVEAETNLCFRCTREWTDRAERRIEIQRRIERAEKEDLDRADREREIVALVSHFVTRYHGWGIGQNEEIALRRILRDPQTPGAGLDQNAAPHAENASLKAENARLREALESSARAFELQAVRDRHDREMYAGWMRLATEARSALEGGAS